MKSHNRGTRWVFHLQSYLLLCSACLQRGPGLAKEPGLMHDLRCTA